MVERCRVIHTAGVSSTAAPHMASHMTTRLRTAMGLWLMGRLPAHIMTHNEKTRRSGSSDKSNSGGIATQHHRCNGKSFQCPFNVTVLCDHTLLWASTCSVVLVLAIMLGAAPGATRKPRMCSFCRSVLQPNIVTPSMRGPATIERVPCSFLFASPQRGVSQRRPAARSPNHAPNETVYVNSG